MERCGWENSVRIQARVHGCARGGHSHASCAPQARSCEPRMGADTFLVAQPGPIYCAYDACSLWVYERAQLWSHNAPATTRTTIQHNVETSRLMCAHEVAYVCNYRASMEACIHVGFTSASMRAEVDGSRFPAYILQILSPCHACDRELQRMPYNAGCCARLERLQLAI